MYGIFHFGVWWQGGRRAHEFYSCLNTGKASAGFIGEYVHEFMLGAWGSDHFTSNPVINLFFLYFWEKTVVLSNGMNVCSMRYLFTVGSKYRAQRSKKAHQKINQSYIPFCLTDSSPWNNYVNAKCLKFKMLWKERNLTNADKKS